MVRRRRDFAPWVLVLGLSTVTGCDHPAAAVETDGGTEAAPADSDAGSEGDPGGGTTTSTTDGGDCAPGLVACGSDCVDTATDPGHCGGCSDACGADQLCATGECVDAPADCSVAGAMCPAGHFCDVATRACLVGCAFDDDCPQPGTCDLSTHTCSCDPGTNFCGMGCVAEGPSACGSSCETCSAAPANAAPACVSSQWRLRLRGRVSSLRRCLCRQRTRSITVRRRVRRAPPIPTERPRVRRAGARSTATRDSTLEVGVARRTAVQAVATPGCIATAWCVKPVRSRRMSRNRTTPSRKRPRCRGWGSAGARFRMRRD